MGDRYTIEYEVTKACDLNCSYCFEHGHFCNINATDEMDIKFVNFVKQSLNEINKDVTVIFWGGEPSMNMKSIKYVYEHLAGLVKFGIYHNGYSSVFTDYVVECTNPTDWDHMQLSYDGKAIQDIHRLTHDGNTTSEYVLRHFDILYNAGFPVTLKATLPTSDINKMYDVWCEFAELSEKYDNISYFPSLDGDCTDDVYNNFKDEVSKISHAEYVRHEHTNDILCSWFRRDNNPKCGHGIGYIIVGVTGQILPCHGVLYYDIPELIIGNVDDADIFDALQSFKEYIEGYMNARDSKCIGCESLMCNMCNIHAYALSKKDNMIDRLVDRCNNKFCRLYKLFGVYGRILLKEC